MNLQIKDTMEMSGCPDNDCRDKVTRMEVEMGHIQKSMTEIVIELKQFMPEVRQELTEIKLGLGMSTSKMPWSNTKKVAVVAGSTVGVTGTFGWLWAIVELVRMIVRDAG